MLLDIKLYSKKWQNFEEQKETIRLFEEFLENESYPYERSNKKGHMTASGFVLSTDFTALLMTYHAKLKMWIQLGGHADGHPLLHEVAFKECKEESGLTSLAFFSLEEKTPLIFDLDRHTIPARKEEPEHFHYDVRYLLLADKKEPLKISEESLDLKWIPLDEVTLYNQEISVARCLKKIQYLLSRAFSQKTFYTSKISNK